MKKPCPLCEKRRLKRIKDRRAYPLAKIHIIRCDSCGFQWLPHKQEMKIDKKYKLGKYK